MSDTTIEAADIQAEQPTQIPSEAVEAPPAKAPRRSRRAQSKPAVDSEAAVEAPVAEAAAVEAPAAEATAAATEAPAVEAPAAESKPKRKRAPKKAPAADAAAPEAVAPEAQAAADAAPSSEAPADAAAPVAEAPAAQPAEQADASADAPSGPPAADDRPARTPRRRRGRGNGQQQDQQPQESGNDQPSEPGGNGNGNGNGSGSGNGNGAENTESKPDDEQTENGNRRRRTRGQNVQVEPESGRRNRTRDRRRGRGDDADVEILEDDVLLPVAGILDVLDNYAFVRTSGYLPGPTDVYVSLGQVKKYNLRKGDAVVGAIKQPREGENQGQGRQKFNALVRVDSVNGQSPDEAANRKEFSKLTPLYAQDRLRLETTQGKLSTRVIDLVAPIGKGQRGLIVSPPKAGKTLIMQAIANAISENNPEVHLMIVLVDERPEEVTDFQRTVKGEVIASTFDRPAEDHTTVAELAIERAKRLVELDQDVVVLLDGITRLGRAYNLSAPASGRILSGGVDSSALYPPKKFFGAARNIEHGGSLTILATALVETGSKMDEVIFEEFKGTGNMELRLSRQMADKRIFPAVDVNASGTRREEMLLGVEETKVMWKLRRALAGLDTQGALDIVLKNLKETGSNVEFLMKVSKSTPGNNDHA